MIRVLKLCVLAFVVCALFTLTMSAQTTGTLRGRVLDPSGAGVPGASVTLSGPNNTVQVAQSDSTGNFASNPLPPGSYTIRVSANGFGLAEKTMDLPAGRASTLEV